MSFTTCVGQEIELMPRDLALAIEVQRRMQPRNPQLATVRCAGRSEAARGVGGDYYDFLDLQAKTLGLVLADVSGKGPAAALTMASLAGAIRAEAARGVANLVAMLGRLNTLLFETTLDQQYATLFFGRYSEETRRMRYVNCGQQPAMVIRRDGSAEWLKTTAMPLGLMPEWEGLEQEVELRDGDTLWVCSDGVTEAGIERGSELGEEGLIELLEAQREVEIEAAVERVAETALKLEGAVRSDDLTVVGVRCVLDRIKPKQRFAMMRDTWRAQPNESVAF